MPVFFSNHTVRSSSAGWASGSAGVEDPTATYSSLTDEGKTLLKTGFTVTMRPLGMLMGGPLKLFSVQKNCRIGREVDEETAKVSFTRTYSLLAFGSRERHQICTCPGWLAKTWAAWGL
jgi:hypothetical protein